MIFKQFFESKSSTYTYLLACEQTRAAVIIDPVASEVSHYLAELAAQNLHLVYTLDTHVHADHITGAALLRDQCGSKSILHRQADVACGDILITDGTLIRVGSISIEARYTPGHTDACTSYVVDKMVFTGDALLINGCGRTDFQGGDAGTLYDSIQQQLFSLSDDTVVYPAHDYQGRLCSTIGQERLHNIRLGENRSRESFVELMNHLVLPYPAQINAALPANKACGSLGVS